MEEKPTVELKLGDLQSVIKVIDVAASRGAFRGEEMTAVGQVRDRVVAFLKASLPPEAQEENSNNGNGAADAAEEVESTTEPVQEERKPRTRRGERPVA